MALQRFIRGMEKQMPYMVMVFAQFLYSGMALFSKAAIAQGMKPSIFVAYRQAFATLVLSPFAFFLESKESPPLTLKLLCKIFLTSLFGLTLSMNLYYEVMNHTSATFVTAVTNTIPVIVFILAVCLRMESLAITKRHGIAKVFGSVTGLAGAMIFTFYKGPSVYPENSKQISHSSVRVIYTREEWIKGSVIMLGANITWALWLIMQAKILREYPAKLRLTALQCCFSCIVSAFYSACVDRKISSWKIGWNIHLLAVVYCGVIVNGLGYWLQLWAMHKKGPVFTSIFSPLALIVTAIFSAVFFKETLHWGSVLAAALLVAGLYSFLWGKNKESKQMVIEADENSSNRPKEDLPLECIVSSPGNNEVEVAGRKEGNGHLHQENSGCPQNACE